MRVLESASLEWIGEDPAQQEYGAEPGGEQFEKEQASAGTPTTDAGPSASEVVKNILSVASEGAKAISKITPALQAKKAQETPPAAPPAKTYKMPAKKTKPTNPLIYVGAIGGGVLVLGLIVYLALK